MQGHDGGHIAMTQAPQSIIDQAQAILAKLSIDALYVRVDGIEVNGQLVLMELGMNEPSLCLAHSA